jgi:SAM-dependent methyltransferase
VSDTKLATGQYDYVLASHCLAHAANALATLREWQRVVKPGGWIFVIVPWKHATFDHRRPYTTLQHMREDRGRGVDEHDLTHLDEILALHDIARDPPARDVGYMRERSLKNFENRCLHHHVFSQRLLFEIAAELGFRVLDIDLVRRMDMVCVYQTPDASPASVPVLPSSPSILVRDESVSSLTGATNVPADTIATVASAPASRTAKIIRL